MAGGEVVPAQATRLLQPFDIDTILASVKKTNRCVVIDESNPFASVSSEIAFQIQERAFDYLDAPPVRLGVPVVHATVSRFVGDLNRSPAPLSRRYCSRC